MAGLDVPAPGPSAGKALDKPQELLPLPGPSFSLTATGCCLPQARVSDCSPRKARPGDLSGSGPATLGVPGLRELCLGGLGVDCWVLVLGKACGRLLGLGAELL